jgi:phosphoglycerate dehydrogenase-like enzyme
MMASNQIEVLITVPFPDEILARLREVSPRLRIILEWVNKAEEVGAETWQLVEVLYTDGVLPKPEQVPNLRWVQFHRAGMDRWLKEPLLQKPGLIVTSLSGAAAPQIAEYVLMMLLSLGHRLRDMMESQQRVEWPGERGKRFSPRELRGSTVGIVGYGSIGREIARLLHAFGATILATKRDLMHPEADGYLPAGLGDPDGSLARRLYPPQALRSMIKECDFVVITLPLTPDTQGLFDAEAFTVMKPGAFLVDVSRGGIVNLTALETALRDHKLAGAALDVFPQEPLPVDSPLWKVSNLIITPHIAGNSPMYEGRAADLFAENLERYLKGEPLLNQVKLEVGY